MTIKMKPFMNILILLEVIAVVAVGFKLKQILSNKEDVYIPRVEVTKSADGKKNIVVRATLPQIKKEIAPIVIEEFLSETKISCDDKAGLKLLDFKDNSVLSRYGFKRGDIIKEINGRKISSTDDALKICDALEKDIFADRDAKEISVAISRAGQDIDMSFEVPVFVPEKVSYAMTLKRESGR